MKQNSSILFHMGTHSFLRKISFAAAIGIAFLHALSVSAAETTQPLAYQEYFDPTKGFKPAQANFAKIFLQMAGSLEYSGSPELYLRQFMAEQTRIDALYQKATGKTNSSRPPYLTDAYLENLITSWNNLSAVLKLDNFCRLAGRDMRYAIMGSWNKAIPELLEQETNLTPGEKSIYQTLLEKPFFTKADFPTLEAFSMTTLDQLSEDGKSQISMRTWRGQQSPEKRTATIATEQGGTMLVAVLNEHQDRAAAYFQSAKAGRVSSDDLETLLIARLKIGKDIGDVTNLPALDRDPLYYAHEIETALEKRFEHVRKNAKTAEQAETIHAAIISMLENLVVVAHFEFLAALREQSAK